MRVRKLFVGGQLRDLREQRGLRQAELARALGVSASYLNQIEHNRRPLTARVLDLAVDALRVDPSVFEPHDTLGLMVDLREALADAAPRKRVSNNQARELIASNPDVAQAIVVLHRRLRDAEEQVDLIAGSAAPPTSYEEVRDFFYGRHNYVCELDEAGEQVASDEGLRPLTAVAALAARMSERHGVTFAELAPGDGTGDQWRFDRSTRVLSLSPYLSSSQRAFQMATQLAFLEHRELIDELAAGVGFTSVTARTLARIGLANYFAGAVLLPYSAFHEAAEELRYDVDLLSGRFGVSFESVSHRLSTLQRPGKLGVPFSFVRVDRAGNVSKRQSASSFHVSRVGGTCPLWDVYEAFGSPGRLLVQVAEMPDGRRYLWIARTIERSQGGFGTPGKLFAIGLGCDVSHAHRLVYSAGLDYRAGPATPIGLGCKICERPNCPQRAYPPVGRELIVDPDRSRFAPYSTFHS
jgi:predicted transcriptional regulator/DNA-binding XRE family transcriptional regulator